jgi:hypothetical protein
VRFCLSELRLPRTGNATMIQVNTTHLRCPYCRCIEEVLGAVPPHLPYCRARELSSLVWAAAKVGAWTTAAEAPFSPLGQGRGAPTPDASVSGSRWWALMLDTMQPLLPYFNPQVCVCICCMCVCVCEIVCVHTCVCLLACHLRVSCVCLHNRACDSFPHFFFDDVHPQMLSYNPCPITRVSLHSYCSPVQHKGLHRIEMSDTWQITMIFGLPIFHAVVSCMCFNCLTEHVHCFL